jgi:hypothetical protein
LVDPPGERTAKAMVDQVFKARIEQELVEAERKAWDALSRYKFQMFGYWAAIWVHLNRISGEQRPNPFKAVVQIARSM